jgi:nucleotide-binding universal stress UspA family protein
MSATIVVGWDGSAHAQAALATAARLAAGGRIVAVHAHEPAAPHVSARWQELLQQESAERSRALLRELEPLGRPELEGIDLQLRSMDGPAASALMAAADEADADAIAIGTRGIGETTTAVGSVALGLVQGARRPVLVVPASMAARP